MKLTQLQDVLNFQFVNQDILMQSLIHSSYINEHPESTHESNERLEFLGDALLDFVIAVELYQRHPEMPEGDLTMARSTLVRGDALADAARALNMGELLSLGQGEERSGGRHRASNLAGAFEALVGAAYLDQGYVPARDLILRILENEIMVISRNGITPDPKSRLQEIMQKQGKLAPVYIIVSAAGPEHSRRFVAEVSVEGRVLGQGKGARKLEAERQAALSALIPLDG